MSNLMHKANTLMVYRIAAAKEGGTIQEDAVVTFTSR